MALGPGAELVVREPDADLDQPGGEDRGAGARLPRDRVVALQGRKELSFHQTWSSGRGHAAGVRTHLHLAEGDLVREGVVGAGGRLDRLRVHAGHVLRGRVAGGLGPVVYRKRRGMEVSGCPWLAGPLIDPSNDRPSGQRQHPNTLEVDAL